MATFRTVTKAEMPARAKAGAGRLAARMREYDEYVRALKPSEAGRLEPEEGETVRGIALRLSRAARRLEKSLDIRSTPEAVYFSLAS